MNLLEARKLHDAARKLKKLKFDLKEFCFDKQLAFIEDPAPFKTAVCSRRAGKTVASAAHLIHAALGKERVVCLYITLSRSNGKKIIWPELLEINRVFSLGGKPNESELSLTFENRSVVYVSGAKDKTEIEKFRGLALYLCYIDECQSFRSHIENLVDEVISKALFDHNGTLCLTGTPGPVPSGYFHACAESPEWSHHGWTMFENPWLEKKSGHTAQVLVERDLKRKGVGVNDPTIQRECYGRWVVDTNALVFKYDPIKNHFNSDSRESLSAMPWRYVMGVDLGFDDADAIAILGFNDRLSGVYLCDEIVKPKQGITDLVKQIHELNQKYKPDKIVMDTGGLGKKIAEEITTRYAIMIEPAEKVRKFEFIELLNDALRTGRFFASKFSRFAQDAALLEWERDPEKANEKPKIRDSFHSDILDATLYAFRESFHWLYEPQAEPIIPNTNKWFEKQAADMEEAAKNSLHDPTRDVWEEPLEKLNDWNQI